MTTFNDRDGVAWDLDLTIAGARKLKSRLDFDIDNVVTFDPKAGKSTLERLSTDIELLFNVIYVLCEKQCRDKGLSEEDFAAGFDGDIIEKATDALLEEIINFTPPQKRKVLLKLRQLGKQRSEQLGQMLDEILEDPKYQEELQERMDEYLGELKKELSTSPTNVPESSE